MNSVMLAIFICSVIIILFTFVVIVIFLLRANRKLRLQKEIVFMERTQEHMPVRVDTHADTLRGAR